MAASENVWEGRTAGVKLMRASLLLRLSEGEDVGQLLEENKGTYSKKLKGWLVEYRNLKISPCDPSGSWLNMNVEGEFAVFKPVRGLQISTTFMNLEDGQALCGVVAGDCGWMVYVGGMTEEQLEELEHGQEIVVRLNVVTMELSGLLLLMGYRIFEGNNNDENGVAVDEEGNKIQEVEVEVEEEQEGCDKGEVDEVEQEVDAEDKEKKGERASEKIHLNPVVRLKRLKKGNINAWDELDIKEEQDGGEESEGEEMVGGSILTRGLKFSSAQDFLLFMGDAALQSSAVEVNHACAEEEDGGVQGKGEEDGSLEKEAELGRCVERSSGCGGVVLNPVVRVKKLDVETRLGSKREPSKRRKSGISGTA